MYSLRRGLKTKGFENLPKRDLYALLTRVMLTFPLAWNRLFKRLHFSEGNNERYGFVPRSGERPGRTPVKGSYSHKKWRLYGHQRALVFTGRGMDEALANDFATAGRRHTGSLWARATLPRVFNLRNPKSRSDPPKEVTKVLASEQRVLENIAQEKLGAEFRRHSGYRG